jgi:hypothetical protein
MWNRLKCCLAIVLTIVVSQSWQPLNAQSIYQRPTAVKAIIVGSRNLYDGNFNGSGKANMCGLIPKESSLTGTAVFVIEYPNDDPGNAGIQSLSFGSKQLVGKTIKTPVFRLNVAVRLPSGSKPYAYVLNTDDPTKPKNKGTATLASSASGLKLTVSGTNDRGETINLTVECK